VSRITNKKAGNSRKLRVSAHECKLLVNFVSVQYTSLLVFAVSSVEFHCVLCCFFNILLNKTPWDQRRIMIAKLNEVFVYIFYLFSIVFIFFCVLDLVIFIGFVYEFVYKVL
jgi:hypothetical protein